jgi:hypothetical protein
MTPEQLFDRTIPEPNSGCWLWANFCDEAGYGRLARGAAHRVSYELHKGPIPVGGCILHSCDQPSCVNPDHLRVGTRADNVGDMVKRHRSAGPVGEEQWAAQLSEPQVLAIRADTRGAGVLAKEYGISRQHVWKIRTKQYWKHLT